MADKKDEGVTVSKRTQDKLKEEEEIVTQEEKDRVREMQDQTGAFQEKSHESQNR